MLVNSNVNNRFVSLFIYLYLINLIKEIERERETIYIK